MRRAESLPVWLWPWLFFLFLIPFEGMLGTLKLGLPFNLLGLASVALLLLAPLRKTRVNWRVLAVLPLLVALDLSFWFSIDMQRSRYALMPINLLALIYFLVGRLSFSQPQIEWMFCAWMRGGGCLALTTILAYLQGKTGIDGRAGFLADPNYVVAELLMPLAVALYSMRKGSKEGMLWLFPILTAACLTQSRGGLVAMLSIFLALRLCEGRWKSALLLGGMIVVLYLGFSSSLGRFDLTSDPTGSGRTEIWKVALSQGVENWRCGLGFGAFSIITNSACHLYLPQDVHNTYIQSFVETGLFGFLGVLFAMGAHLRIRRPIGKPVLACLIGMMVSAVFLDILYYKFLWVAWILAYQASSEELPVDTIREGVLI